MSQGEPKFCGHDHDPSAELSIELAALRAKIAEYEKGCDTIDKRHAEEVAAKEAEIERLKKLNAEDLAKLEEAVNLGSSQAEQYDKELAALREEVKVLREQLKQRTA